jgi:predicted transcriptional regulator
MKAEKITCSHTMPQALKKELQQFAKHSYKTESEIIEQALARYFKSDKAFQELRKAEAEKQEFFKQLDEDCSLRNLVVPRDQLCK